MAAESRSRRVCKRFFCTRGSEHLYQRVQLKDKLHTLQMDDKL